MCNTKLNSDIQFTLTPQMGGNDLIITVSDQVSGSIVGRRTIRCVANGDLPALTVADAIEMVGGRYRVGCLRVDFDCRCLKARSARASRTIRDHDRRVRQAQLRRAAE